MTNYFLNRRRFFSSAGGVFILPLLESLFPVMSTAAAAANDPRRYISFYFPNGTYNRSDQVTWYPPSGAISVASLPPVLTPFAAIAADLSVYKDISTSAADNLSNANGQHTGEPVAFMTCSPNMNPQISFEHMIAAKCGKAAIVFQGNTADQGDKAPDNAISF